MSLDISGGISRSGRVRKKSAKLKEMEEIEKSDVNGDSSLLKQHNSSNSLLSSSSFTNGSLTDQDSTPRKSKKLKIKFSLDDTRMEKIPIDDEIEQSDEDQNYQLKSEPTVPSLKIKLFQNSIDNYCTLPKKDKKSTPNSKRLYTENTANLLFQQITSGHIPKDSKKKSEKKSSADYTENLLFDPADELSDEEASLVISDSNESLQAALEHTRPVKNPPNRRLIETKIETTKLGMVKLKKIDCKTDKKQKLSRITAYTLFAKENRSRIQQSCPNLGFADVSKRLGEVWQGLPQREKMQWKRKAQKQKGLNAIQQLNNQKISTSIATKLTTSQTRFIRHNPSNSINNRSKQRQPDVNLHSKTELLNKDQINSYLNEPSKPVTTSSIDLASHLKILGDSLNAMSSKLNNDEVLNESDALDLLLDSAVCAISPLICLTKFIPEMNGCNENTHRQLLDNVAFLMPGL